MNFKNTTILSFLSAVLIAGIFIPFSANAVEFKTNLQTDTIIVEDSAGKTFVGMIAQEEGFDSSAFGGAVVTEPTTSNETTTAEGNETVTQVEELPSNETTTTTEPATTNETSTEPAEIDSNPVVLVPVPEGNDTTIIVVTENETAIIETVEETTGETNTTVTEIDNTVETDGGVVNETSVPTDENIEIIVDLPTEIEVVTTPTSNETTIEEPQIEVPEIVNGTTTEVEEIGNATDGEIIQEPTTEETQPQDDCPITGLIYQSDGSTKEFKLCYIQ